MTFQVHSQSQRIYITKIFSIYFRSISVAVSCERLKTIITYPTFFHLLQTRTHFLIDEIGRKEKIFIKSSSAKQTNGLEPPTSKKKHLNCLGLQTYNRFASLNFGDIVTVIEIVTVTEKFDWRYCNFFTLTL